jgi:hypothetical protein
MGRLGSGGELQRAARTPSCSGNRTSNDGAVDEGILSHEYSGSTGPASGEYSVEDDNQLQPEDTLVERASTTHSTRDIRLPSGCTDVAPSAAESMEQMLAEEEPDPAARINAPLDKDEQQRSTKLTRSHSRRTRRTGASRSTCRAGRSWRRHEAELVAGDVGISGSSLGRYAVHIIDDEEYPTARPPARDQRLSDRRHDDLTPVADGDGPGCIW